MSEPVIERHNFETAKNELQVFSNQAAIEPDLKHVRDKKDALEFLFGGGWSLEHSVTGQELNDLTVQIQSHLQSINDMQLKLIREFGQVYTALDALDNDYIKAILSSINAISETNKGLNNAQEKIRKLVDDEKKTLEVLKKFKHRLDGYSHLKDIDHLWLDNQKLSEEILEISANTRSNALLGQENKEKTKALSESLDATNDRLARMDAGMQRVIEKTEQACSVANELERIAHLEDIDAMWGELEHVKHSLQAFQDNMVSLQENVAEQKADLADVKTFINSVSGCEHLQDVDVVWAQNETNMQQIRGLQKSQTETTALIQVNREQVETSITDMNNKFNATLLQMNQKLRCACLLAGSSLGIAVIEMIIIFMRLV